ncbi:PCRF domain-containing protein, partial [candidate division KSB1 bacterium]|nr:PCRF domain-containing protein [candidate division KSB1 bacterium]
MFERLDKIRKRYEELNQQLSDQAIVSDPKKLATLAKERSEIDGIVNTYEKYLKVHQNIEDDRTIIHETTDREFRELAQTELEELEKQEETLIEELKVLLIPKDPRDSRNVIMEIRAGTGGDEAGLFAGDLYRMYQRFIETEGWKMEIMDMNSQGIGGFKEIIFSVSGKDVYGKLKYES